MFTLKLFSITINCYTLERLLEQIPPVHIKGMQPRWNPAGLEGFCVFVCILSAHHLKAGNA